MKNEKAVSPVIGVILMVAITVILAAIIAAFVFGLSGNIPKSANNVSSNQSPVQTIEQPAITKHAVVIWDDGDIMKAHIPEDRITCYVLRTTAVGMNQFFTMSCLPDKDLGIPGGY